MMCRMVICIVFTAIVSLAVNAHAEIYKWTDEKGKVHYSNSPQDAAKKEEIISPEIVNVTPGLETDSKQEPDSRSSSRNEPIVDPYINHFKPIVVSNDRSLTPMELQFNEALKVYEDEVVRANQSYRALETEKRRLRDLATEKAEWEQKSCSMKKITKTYTEEERKANAIRSGTRKWSFKEQKYVGNLGPKTYQSTQRVCDPLPDRLIRRDDTERLSRLASNDLKTIRATEQKLAALAKSIRNP